MKKNKRTLNVSRVDLKFGRRLDTQTWRSGITKKFGFSPKGRGEREAKRLAIKMRREALASIEI